ncbi:MAG: leucine-rich repeat protein [Oscillospiraceae bacterium]|nr:leucine-rich repeat protein [Oscillospiraceae bacterium]
MKKKCLALFLSLVICLALTAPAGAAKVDASNMPGHEILSLLPATLQRPAYPNTVGQTDPLLVRYTDFEAKEKNWPYEQSLESVFQEIVDLTDSLTTGKTTDTQKVKAIFDWVSQNIEYGILIDGIDEEGYLLKVDAYADPLQVYIRRHARCEGYALLSQFMCTIAGIPAAYIAGKDRYYVSGPGHAWNAALADDRWIFFDATWSEWDMGPDYHKTSSEFAYYDGVFLMDAQRTMSTGETELYMRLRTGFLCPDNVTVPDGVTWVDLQNCPNLTGITLPDSVTDVYFAGCTGLTDVTLPAGIVQMNFSGCTNLKSVNIPNSVTTIGNSAFHRCASLKSITIPNSVTAIDHMAFADSGLRSVTIPGSVTGVGSGAFYRCADLKSVTMEKGVGSIEDSAFMECTSLTDVTIPGTVATIGRQAFYGCTALESITIPEGVTTIEDLAFFDCANLRLADLPDSVTSLGNGVFTGCPKLESTNIPAGMTSIGIGAFQGRSDLTSVTIPDYITEIGERAFSDCTGLTEVVIPQGVKTIKYAAFRGCTGLESVTIPSSVTTIENEVFSGCTGLTSLMIPEGVTSIGNMATPYTLESITLPTSVTSIGGLIFGGKMKDVYYAGTEAQWKAISFAKNSLVERVTVHYNSAGPKTSIAPTVYTATPTNDALKVDGKSQVPTAYKIGDSNYFQLRDVAMMLNGTPAQFSVDYDEARQAVVIVIGQPYKPLGTELVGAAKDSAEAILGNNDIYINGKKADFAVYKINGANFFQIRALGQALGFNVGWSAEQGMFIESDKPYDPNN